VRRRLPPSLERCPVTDGDAVVAARRILQGEVALVLLAEQVVDPGIDPEALEDPVVWRPAGEQADDVVVVSPEGGIDVAVLRPGIFVGEAEADIENTLSAGIEVSGSSSVRLSPRIRDQPPLKKAYSES
jgi:hypothetical protein